MPSPKPASTPSFRTIALVFVGVAVAAAASFWLRPRGEGVIATTLDAWIGAFVGGFATVGALLLGVLIVLAVVLFITDVEL